MHNSPNLVRVGVSVFLKRPDGKYLFGQRKNSLGEGCWANPGGHLEFGESIESCARREVLEETGLTLSNVRFLGLTNDIFEAEAKHYITLHMLAVTQDDEAQLLEPHKVAQWQWFEANALPDPLFLSIRNLVADKPEFFISQPSPEAELFY